MQLVSFRQISQLINYQMKKELFDETQRKSCVLLK